jgi:tRNA(Ile)-lysidine synthetase-like protein
MQYRSHRRKVSGILKNARVPAWERGDLVALAGREDVVAVLGANVALSDGGDADDCYYFRIAPPPPPAQPPHIETG